MLQRIIKRGFPASFLMLTFSVLLFSFSNKMGGDSFEVYIGKKLMFQQYVTRGEAVKSLQLEQSDYNNEIEVYYSHCGATGTSRVISIRDGQNKVLKEWRYQDTPSAKSSMACNVKDVVGLQKLSNGGTLNLYYTSHELPNGRLLASIYIPAGVKSTR